MHGRSSFGGSQVQLSCTPGGQKMLSMSWPSSPPAMKCWRGHLKGKAVPKHWELLWDLGGEQRVLVLQQPGGMSFSGGFGVSPLHCAPPGIPLTPSGDPLNSWDLPVLCWDPLTSSGIPWLHLGIPQAHPMLWLIPRVSAGSNPQLLPREELKRRGLKVPKCPKNRRPEWREFTESYFHDNFNNIPFAKWSWETRNA